MSRFRKLILTLVAACALFAPAALPTQVQPQSVQCQAGVRYYAVYYRSCPQDYWHYWGSYRRASDAQQAVRWFNYYGYQAFYR